MFFDNWYGLLRVVVVGVSTYVCLVVLLRSTGKRTLSKLNAFDFVVTVALGSTLATVLLSSMVSLAEGVTALALLTGLQYVVTWTSVRWRPLRRAVRSEPTMLVYQGTLLRDAMRRERVTESEVRQALRMQGATSLAEVEALVLESDGSFASVAADATILGDAWPPD
ncbi:MAG: hypothetical protein K0Q93_734 [Nocardioidaceae bacterium]|nr:hypothetical protein [Nocardioidaceae bacterium]